MENDILDRIVIGDVDRVAAALGGYARIELVWQGERLDRLVDATHAALQNAVARILEEAGWIVRVEVSFNHFGERGRYDILALQAQHRMLLVVEIKSAIGDVQATLGALDVKVRLANQVAHEFGWAADAVVPALVILDERTQRRHVERHAALFRRFAVRGRTARAWLRRPREPIPAVLLFLKQTDATRDSRITSNPSR